MITSTTMPKQKDNRSESITRGSKNVFADLGYSDAVERQAKLRLAYALNQVLDGRKLSQADAAKVLGVTQPKISALRHYKLAGFSVERLMNLLTALDQDNKVTGEVERATQIAGRFLRYEFLTAILPSRKVKRSQPVTSTRLPSRWVPVNVHSDTPRWPAM